MGSILKVLFATAAIVMCGSSSHLCSDEVDGQRTANSIEFSKFISTEKECMDVFAHVPAASRICFGRDDQIDYYRKILNQSPWDNRELQVAFFDINADGRKDIIVRSLHLLDCGTAGCANGVYFQSSGENDPDIMVWKYSQIGTSLEQIKLIARTTTTAPQLYFGDSSYMFDVELLLKRGRVVSQNDVQ